MGKSKSDHNEGQEDYKKCGGQAKENPLTEALNPSYDPPSDADRKEQYDKGWDNAKEQSESSGGSSSSGSSGGLCFISTACVVARGLPDNCLELRTLRNFRDTFVRGLPQGERIVQDYRTTAPRIVTAITARQDSVAVFNDLYTRLVERSVALVQSGKLREAFINYQGIVQELKETYL